MSLLGLNMPYEEIFLALLNPYLMKKKMSLGKWNQAAMNFSKTKQRFFQFYFIVLPNVRNISIQIK